MVGQTEKLSPEHETEVKANCARPLGCNEQPASWDSGPLPVQSTWGLFNMKGVKFMATKRSEPESLTLPGMAKRSMPPTRKTVGMLWDETPLAKAARQAEIDRVQPGLFEKKEGEIS